MENEPELADDVVSVLIGQSRIMWPSVHRDWLDLIAVLYDLILCAFVSRFYVVLC